MSKLLEMGYSASEVATIDALMIKIKAVNVHNMDSIATCRRSYNDMLTIIGHHISFHASFKKLFKDIYNVDYIECCSTGENHIAYMLVRLPNGKHIRADRVLTGNCEFEYDENNELIHAAKLYGNRNVLEHNANPLDYLKFKCLPHEKLSYSTEQDASVDAEYSGSAPVFLGVELEVERNSKTPKKIEHKVVNDLGMDYVVLKHDGSLQDGFEIVTAPATLAYHHQAWDKFFANSAKLVSSWTSSRCGMHVHISRKAFTPLHLGKLIAFLNNIENRKFVTTIAGRDSEYSKFTENSGFHVKSKLISHISSLIKEIYELNTVKDAKKISTLQEQLNQCRAKLKANNKSCETMLAEISHGYRDRRTSLNLTKAGTVEVRIFRGNVSKIGFFKNLEFVHACVAFTRDATFRTRPLTEAEIKERKLKRKENTDYALHYTFFLEWLFNDTTGNYNNLKQWLQTHKLTDKFIRRSTSDKTPPDKRISDDDINAVA